MKPKAFGRLFVHNVALVVCSVDNACDELVDETAVCLEDARCVDEQTCHVAKHIYLMLLDVKQPSNVADLQKRDKHPRVRRNLSAPVSCIAVRYGRKKLAARLDHTVSSRSSRAIGQ